MNHLKHPSISVITVVKNDVHHIEKTINNVLKQNYPALEYIVIDGCSIDGTKELISKYSNKISTFISEPDRGVYDAMNKGIGHTNGDWIFFLNSGDEFYNYNILNDFSDYLLEENDLVYGNVELIGNDNNSKYRTHKKFSRFFILRQTICHQAIFFLKKNFEKIGLFDLTYPIKADYEWLVRYYFANNNPKYINKCIARFDLTGISSDKKADYSEKLDIVKKYFTVFEYAFLVIITIRHYFKKVFSNN